MLKLKCRFCEFDEGKPDLGIIVEEVNIVPALLEPRYSSLTCSTVPPHPELRFTVHRCSKCGFLYQQEELAGLQEVEVPNEEENGAN